MKFGSRFTGIIAAAVVVVDNARPFSAWAMFLVSYCISFLYYMVPGTYVVFGVLLLDHGVVFTAICVFLVA